MNTHTLLLKPMIMRITVLIVLIFVLQDSIGQSPDTIRVCNRYNYLDLDNSEIFLDNMENPSKLVVKKNEHVVIATKNIDTVHVLKIYGFSEGINDTLNGGWNYNNPYSEELLVSSKNEAPFLDISSLPKGKYELHLHIGLYRETFRLIIK